MDEEGLFRILALEADLAQLREALDEKWEPTAKVLKEIQAAAGARNLWLVPHNIQKLRAALETSDQQVRHLQAEVQRLQGEVDAANRSAELNYRLVKKLTKGGSPVYLARAKEASE